MKRGVFITFEGPEGGGKSANVRLLAEALREIGSSLVVTREPGGTLLGDRVRGLLLDPSYQDMLPVTELLLFEASRHQHTEQIIKPAIEEGHIVLCDRYFDSTLVYQGYGRGLNREIVALLNVLAVGCLTPDLTFLLDVEVEEGLSRKTGQGVWDRLDREAIAFHKRMRDGYLEIAGLEPERWRVINAERPIGEVFGDIWGEVGRFIVSRSKEGATLLGKERRG